MSYVCGTIVVVAALFVNDPVVDAREVVPVARRDHAGEAFGWDPEVCSVADLMGFLGVQDEFVVVGGELYRRHEGGALHPQRPLLERRVVVVRWLSAPVELVDPDEVARRFAKLVVVEPVVKPKGAGRKAAE